MTHKTDANPAEQSAALWKKNLGSKVPADWGREIDIFETEMYLKKQGKIDEKVFAETRLRRGAYGQRYDNGQRHDGKQSRTIPFPTALTKGPMTMWDAPGMERIKIPYGGMNPDQMEVLADLAEEYSDGICHVTTRQDIQLHYIHIEDCPSMFRRLAAVDITTREACGNSVRNVTACPLVGTCPTEEFDVTPYAEATFRYLLGHPDVQDFGRKFKIAFSGCVDKPCGLVKLHDLGLIAATKEGRRGFQYYVGGGLGAVPHQAKLFSDFVPEEELLPLTQAVCRIFARYGEKKNRNRARIKFLVSDWGIDKFRDEVLKERAVIPVDPRWTDFLSRLNALDETGRAAPVQPNVKPAPGFEAWVKANVVAQKQTGFSLVNVVLPLGDITSNQMRDLADIARKFVPDTVRTTVEQNIVLRWVRDEDLPALHQALDKIHLAMPHAGTIVDIVACPGTDTCKLGISASRGLAGELHERLASQALAMDQAIKDLRIKISGCFNSCSQHTVADIGFYGISRKVGGYIVPHFQLVVGGQWTNNAGAYGMAIMGIPSKAAPKAVERLTDLYLKGRAGNETFQDYIKRLGKVELKKALMDLTVVPSHDEDPSYYVDWGGVREFTTSDIGTGECAGEVVSLVDFGLTAADRELFEAQVLLEKGDLGKATQTAFASMVRAAQGLLKGNNPDISDDPDTVVAEFRSKFCDTGLFLDPFVKDKFANFFFKAYADWKNTADAEKTFQRLEEAQLFIDAAHACNARMSMSVAV